MPFDPTRARYVSLATFRRDGSEVRTPVWMAPAGGHHYVFSAGDAGKVKRIRVTGRVRVAECDLRGEIKSGWIDGRGRVLQDSAEIARALQALRAKYGLQMVLGDLFSKLAGRFSKRAYLEITL
ncbi:MAG TPA: PPOX class F420-dependent oxidoreductase [Steroidobacteraceae bacterium]|nr:PPOX class F420-dependent oxidoreductase [Steroidobacteraceae bacterium]